MRAVQWFGLPRLVCVVVCALSFPLLVPCVGAGADSDVEDVAADDGKGKRKSGIEAAYMQHCDRHFPGLFKCFRCRTLVTLNTYRSAMLEI
jgi:hypothetical protein